MPVTLPEFRALLQQWDEEEIVENVLLAAGAKHLSGDRILQVQRTLSKTFGVPVTSVPIWVVGSAKLGFSLTEKRVRNTLLPRYRSFGPDSDIDVAVVSPAIFELIWKELTRYSHGRSYFPWRSEKLGDYLLCGWLRPDHFPSPPPRLCEDWWYCFDQLSADASFGRRKVRGGLFFSLNQLKRYLSRAVRECIHAEATPTL